MYFRWNGEKEKTLNNTREISFEEIVKSINNGGLITTELNKLYSNQIIFVVRIKGYVYAVPAVPEGDNCYFLKTIYPSRKLNKKYKDT
ncbi:MAG: toxin [Spirochaetaceae bacterium]|nr:toxin [Spirochaetaceae bacterium]